MSKSMIIAAVLFGLAALVANSTFFVVTPAEQAIVFQFREKRRVIQEPGLYVKAPFLQDVMYFDKRVLALQPPGQVVILDEQKLLDVNAFARWRIRDPFVFFQSMRDERIALDRLSALLNSSVRNVLGTYKVTDLLSDRRAEILDKIKQEMNNATSRFGVDVIDVRIQRAGLPEETVQNVFNRMRSERQKEAAALRAEGQKRAQETQAKADAERTRLLSEAERDSQKLRGDGDREALKILSDATSRDPQFYAFYRSLEAYRNTLKDGSTTYVLSPDSEFFRVFASGGK